jgi:hypothetical protein
MVKHIALLAAFLCGLTQPAVHAQHGVGRPFVVAIGINNYQDSQIKPRRHAEADATALVKLFLDKERLGVAKEHVKLLLGAGPSEGIPSEKATKDNILKALQWLAKSATKDDFVVLAIFGNGAPVGEHTCYFAIDSTYTNRAKDAIASGAIELLLDKVQSQRFVALLDVDYHGFDPGKEKMPRLNTTNVFRAFLKHDDDNTAQRTGRLVLVAATPPRPSLDLDKHGVFAQTLLDGLNGKADADGDETDGNITSGELLNYVRENLPDLAQAHGKTAEQRKQQPGFFDRRTTDFIVAYNPPARGKALERLKQLDALAQAKRLDATSTADGRALLARMPKLAAQRQLRKAYQQLVDGKIDVAGFNAERASVAESIKLSDKEALKYAIIIVRAADLVRRSYFKQVFKAPLVGHAVAGLYRSVNEEIPAHVQEGIDKLKTMKDAELLKLVAEARRHLGKREDLDQGQDVTNSLNALFATLTPHSRYIPPAQLRKFNDNPGPPTQGIGMHIRRHEASDQLQIITPLFNSPAHKAGLKANDLITTIIAEVNPLTGTPLP